MNISNDNVSFRGGLITPNDPEEAYQYHLCNLKLSSSAGVVVKGLKETIRVIKSGKAKTVYLAEDCEREDYKRVINEFCLFYKVNLVLIKQWTDLRDIVIGGIPSETIIENARKKGKIPKISPKCYCAAIVEQGDVNKLLYELKI
jgi:ribosomal protein L7Ae-like RNA K-turn-binding protein